MDKLHCYYQLSLRRTLVRPVILFSIIVLFLFHSGSLYAQRKASLQFFPADNSFIQYMGRIDFSNPKLPRFWQPAVNISIRFTGINCRLIINDEVLWEKNHNYYELVVDGKAYRLQTKSATDTINVTPYLSSKIAVHNVSFVKNTEANIGYLEFKGVLCSGKLLPASKPFAKKIEFIGNSITCGAGADISGVPCGKGEWHDQHNAYLSYGAITARTLNTQYHLSSVSGIGLMRSCCNMNILMPQVFDKISMRNDSIAWNFDKYQPDVVTVCLGQNDGVQDSTAFSNNYISFLEKLRSYYPEATFVLLSSPMADDKLRKFQRSVLPAIEKSIQQKGDKKIYIHIFEKQYSSGCDWHPSVEEHKQIAEQLTAVIRKIMKW